MMIILSILSIGFLSSFLGSLVGLGGGFIMIPLLTLQMKLDIKEAILLSLISLVGLGLLRTIQSHDLIFQNRKLIRSLALMTIAGSVISAFIGAQLPSEHLNLLFALVVIVVAVYTFQSRNWVPNPDRRERGLWVARGLFLCSGTLGGLLGLGGGIISIPTLHRLLHFSMAESARLNFPFILVSAATALGTYYFNQREMVQSLPVIPVVALVAGTLLGGSLSAKAKISSKKLKLIFAALLLLMGVLKLWKVFNP